MQELHRPGRPTCLPSYISRNRPVGTNRPIDRRLDPFRLAQRRAAPATSPRGTASDHPLLRFGDPDLGVRQARVLERRAFELHLGPDLLAHLADRAD